MNGETNGNVLLLKNIFLIIFQNNDVNINNKYKINFKYVFYMYIDLGHIFTNKLTLYIFYIPRPLVGSCL